MSQTRLGKFDTMALYGVQPWPERSSGAAMLSY
ncbi:hypothetical protein X742_22735 [Mesorhizobium sp. LNHC232B00]|jgi:hypothetical protein|nr:hypothetical protein X742_22735 [Mesorhizobium sp. LNHC232B00]